MAPEYQVRGYPTDDHSHTICCLELCGQVDLAKNAEWAAAANTLASTTGVDGLLYSYDLDCEKRLVVVVTWQPGTPVEMQMHATRSALAKMTSVASPLFCCQMLLGLQLTNSSSSSEMEIYIVKGDKSVVTPELLDFAVALEESAAPSWSEELPESFNSATLGVNPLEDDGTRTITFVLHFDVTTGSERSSFKDPERDSYGGARCYEELIAEPIKKWKQSGATVNTYAVRLRYWKSA